MDGSTLVVVLLAMLASICGAALLCRAIDRRAKAEARRERLGIAPGLSPWP